MRWKANANQVTATQDTAKPTFQVVAFQPRLPANASQPFQSATIAPTAPMNPRMWST